MDCSTLHSTKRLRIDVVEKSMDFCEIQRPFSAFKLIPRGSDVSDKISNASKVYYIVHAEVEEARASNTVRGERALGAVI